MVQVIVVWMTFSIFTSQAFTFVWTLKSSAETLAIFFLTSGFFASAFSQRHKGRDVLEETRVAVVGDLFGLVYLKMILGFVWTADTNAAFTACASTGETLAIKFETVNFGALTPLGMLFVLEFDGSGRGGVKTVMGNSWGPVLIEETVKEITSIIRWIELGFDIGGVDELGLHGGSIGNGDESLNFILVAELLLILFLAEPGRNLISIFRGKLFKKFLTYFIWDFC